MQALQQALQPKPLVQQQKTPSATLQRSLARAHHEREAAYGRCSLMMNASLRARVALQRCKRCISLFPYRREREIKGLGGAVAATLAATLFSGALQGFFRGYLGSRRARRRGVAKRSGIAAAVAEAVDRDEAADEAPEQLALLPLAPAPTRQGGRPPGVKNRRTAEFADYVLSRYRSPIVALAETYSRPVADLAKELGCTRAEAFELQLRAAKEVAPYLHAKQPLGIEAGGGGVPVVIMATPEMATMMRDGIGPGSDAVVIDAIVSGPQDAAGEGAGDGAGEGGENG